MTQSASGPIRVPASFGRAALLAAMLTAGALPALAQVETWRSPSAAVPPRQNVTSSLEATAPSATEQREARALAAALFAKPGAAARAADKAVPVTQFDAAAVQPKPEWAARDGLQFGGKGLLFKSPF